MGDGPRGQGRAQCCQSAERRTYKPQSLTARPGTPTEPVRRGPGAGYWPHDGAEQEFREWFGNGGWGSPRRRRACWSVRTIWNGRSLSAPAVARRARRCARAGGSRRWSRSEAQHTGRPRGQAGGVSRRGGAVATSQALSSTGRCIRQQAFRNTRRCRSHRYGGQPEGDSCR